MNKKRTKKYKKPVKFECVRNTEEMVKHESGHALSLILALATQDNLEAVPGLRVSVAFDKQKGYGHAVLAADEACELSERIIAFHGACSGPAGALALADQPTALMFCYDKDITKLRTASDADQKYFHEGMDALNPLQLPTAQTIWLAVQFLMGKHYDELFAGHQALGHKTASFDIDVLEFVQRHESLLKYAVEYGAAIVETLNKAVYEVENGIVTPQPKSEAVLQ